MRLEYRLKHFKKIPDQVLSFEDDFYDFEVAHYDKEFNLKEWAESGQSGLKGEALKDVTSFPFVYKMTNSGVITIKFTNPIDYTALQHPIAVELPKLKVDAKTVANETETSNEEFWYDYEGAVKPETTTVTNENGEEVPLENCDESVDLNCVPHRNITIHEYFKRYLKDTRSVQVEYIPSTRLYRDKVGLDFEITSLSDVDMQIQVVFQNPEYVSSGFDPDLIQVQFFNTDKWFISDNKYAVVLPEGYYVQKILPP